MNSNSPLRTKRMHVYRSLGESPLSALRGFESGVLDCFRMRDEFMCQSPRRRHAGEAPTRQNGLRQLGLPALRQLRCWCASALSDGNQSEFLEQFDLAIKVLDKFGPESASGCLAKFNRSLLESAKSTLAWQDAAKVACAIASLRDVTEALGARGAHELGAGRNRIIAHRGLWCCPDLRTSMVDAIAQVIHFGDLIGIEPQTITSRRVYQEEGVSWHAENEGPGWFLLLWVVESGALTTLWPSIRVQANLLSAQDRLSCAVNKLGAAVSSLCA